MCGSYFLGFVKVSFCFALLVDHHQTTIWENMCYSFQAVFANLSFFGFTSFCLPPLCAIDITKVRSYIYIYNLFLFAISRWWFQILFMFIPTWGNDPI